VFENSRFARLVKASRLPPTSFWIQSKSVCIGQPRVLSGTEPSAHELNDCRTLRASHLLSLATGVRGTPDRSALGGVFNRSMQHGSQSIGRCFKA
jgi:hypothetical protein